MRFIKIIGQGGISMIIGKRRRNRNAYEKKANVRWGGIQ